MILVDNAIRHSPRGAAVRVVVRAATRTPRPSPSRMPARASRRRTAPRVFDRFWRAPGAPAGGTGLGLAIAKWIAEHHDGSISVDRSAAGGARFEVRLPDASQPSPHRRPPRELVPPLRHSPSAS